MYIFKRTSNTSERLQIAMEIRGKRQSDLSRETGIDKSSLSNYLKGTYEPKQKAIYALARALRVNEMWLWGYDIDMDAPSEEFSPSSPAPAPELSKNEKVILSLFNDLNDEGQAEAIKYLDYLDSREEYKKCYLPENVAEA